MGRTANGKEKLRHIAATINAHEATFYTFTKFGLRITDAKVIRAEYEADYDGDVLYLHFAEGISLALFETTEFKLGAFAQELAYRIENNNEAEGYLYFKGAKGK